MRPAVDRRRFLQLLAAAALSPESRAAGRLRVVIAGAGIIGASIAYHLAKAGADVTVIDRQGPASHASRASFAWLNATWSKQPRGYHALNQAGVAGWKALQPELKLPVRWGGSLEGYAETENADQLAARAREQVEWGERTRAITGAELAALEPDVNFSAAPQAIFSENDGAADPVGATQAFLAAAASLGARVHTPCELTGVSIKAGSLAAVETSCGRIEADKLVLATGAAQDSSRRFANLDFPQRPAPGLTAITAPMPRLINRVLWMPGIHLHQRDDGRVVLGEEAGPPQNEAHAERLRATPNDFPSQEIALQHADRLLAAALHYVPRLAGATFENVHLCWRPMPLDGLPVLGASPVRPDVYLAVMHSGMTLAPIVGRLAASELIDGSKVEQLKDFRPERRFGLGGPG